MLEQLDLDSREMRELQYQESAEVGRRKMQIEGCLLRMAGARQPESAVVWAGKTPNYPTRDLQNLSYLTSTAAITEKIGIITLLSPAFVL